MRFAFNQSHMLVMGSDLLLVLHVFRTIRVCKAYGNLLSTQCEVQCVCIA